MAKSLCIVLKGDIALRALFMTCCKLAIIWNQQAAFDAVFLVVPHLEFPNVAHHLFEASFDATVAVSLGDISFDNSIERLRIRYETGGILPVTTLSPFYTLTTGRIKCSMVDYLIQFGVKRFGFERVSGFFAGHVARALTKIRGMIHLMCYPPHSPGTESKLAPIIRAMCREDGNRFLMRQTFLCGRSKARPQRSTGGNRPIGVQLDTIECRLPPDAANATFVCLDDVLNTGASFHVFALLMTRAGANGDNLHGLALGRFTAHGPDHEMQTDFVIPVSSIVSDVSVPVVAEFCVDVPVELHLEANVGCREIADWSSGKTLAFASAGAALAAAGSWLDQDILCCPHFPIEDRGFPCQLVSKAPQVARMLPVDGRSLFLLSQVGNMQGADRDRSTQRAHGA